MANKKVLEEYTGVPRADWLYTQFKSDGLLHPGHVIGIDRRVGAIVFAIRGTMSLSDTLTDLSAVPGVLMVRSLYLCCVLLLFFLFVLFAYFWCLCVHRTVTVIWASSKRHARSITSIETCWLPHCDLHRS